MRAGGSASPEAHTQANSVIYSLLPSLIAWVRSPASQIALEKIHFLRSAIPTKKPFSSILYVLRSSIPCSSILECSKLKYNSYLCLLSARWRSRSIPVSHLVVTLSGWRWRNRSTQLSETSCCATALPKVFQIPCVGGRPSLVALSICLTTSCSCWFAHLALWETCKPLCRRDGVVRLTPNVFATWRYGKLSPASRNSKYSIASWIGSMVVKLWRVEDGTTRYVGMVGWLVTRSGSSRARLSY